MSIYSATYSNVPVYEFNIAGNHVMRRRADDWINATHILKVADFDKPARTRILEREVQKGTHEKVQGGYGKYQGTWIPLQDGRDLATRIGCVDKLLPIFDFVPGDRSPPPAPRHATAASRPRASQASNQSSRRAASKASRLPSTIASSDLAREAAVSQPRQSQMSEVSYDNYSQAGFVDDHTPDNRSIISESEADLLPNSQYSIGSRNKRKREMDQPPAMSFEDQQHLLWSDELLDYFMLQRTDEALPTAPEPAPGIDLNRPVDEKGHTPLHWAAAMGDMPMVRQLVSRGANFDTITHAGETPLMHAIAFTNNYDKQTMPVLTGILHSTAGQKDWYGSTILHHISASTCSKSKYRTARYYFVSVLEKLQELYEPQQVRQLIDQQDQNGDTAVFLAAKYGARKCVRVLIDFGARTDIVNKKGESALDLINELNARRQSKLRGVSSSPVQALNTQMDTIGASGSQPITQSASQLFASEAASMLASQLPSLVSSRTEALASALEQELSERQREAEESERLLHQRQKEIETLQAQSLALTAKEEPDELSDMRNAEVEELSREVVSLMECEQALSLDKALKEAQTHVPKTKSSATSSLNQLNERITLAHQMAQLQLDRYALVTDLVRAQSLAGDENRHKMYKRLIIGALGVKAEDVEAMLPEILHELEDVKDDAAATFEADQDGRAETTPIARVTIDGQRITASVAYPTSAAGAGHAVHVLG